MKRLFNLTAAVVLAASFFVAGCGDGSNLPDNTREDAGKYVSSERYALVNTETDWTIRTTKGVFAAYTSLQVPAETPVTLKFTLTPHGPNNPWTYSDFRLIPEGATEPTMIHSVISLPPRF